VSAIEFKATGCGPVARYRNPARRGAPGGPEIGPLNSI